MLIALASLKGSPGVTTTALALAVSWPARGEVVTVECDPAGGDLAPRAHLGYSPGLVEAAAACRRAPASDVVWRHTQSLWLPALGLQLPVAVGPPGTDQAQAALRTLGGVRGFWEHLAAGPGVVLADCGRLDPQSPALAVLRAASTVVVVARPRLVELSHVDPGLAWVKHANPHTSVALVGSGYSEREVAETLGVGVLGDLPCDKRGVAAVHGTATRQRAAARMPLLRGARTMATRLRSQAAHAARPAADSHPSPDGNEPSTYGTAAAWPSRGASSPSEVTR